MNCEGDKLLKIYSLRCFNCFLKALMVQHSAIILLSQRVADSTKVWSSQRKSYCMLTGLP